MDEETSLKLFEVTDKAVREYNDYNEKKIILTENEIVEEYNFRTANIERTCEPIDFGFTDRYFGGNIFKCAIVRDSPFVVLVDYNLNTLGVHIPRYNLDLCSHDFLKDLCVKYSVTFAKNDSKKVLASKLTGIA